MNKPITVAVDFDGTCVEHAYPAIGDDIGAQEVLKWLVSRDVRLILFTMRSDIPLIGARTWFTLNEIPLFGINENPEQSTWTSSPKPYAQIYIDDAALGCPLIQPDGRRPYVDWVKVREMLGEMI